MIGVARPAPAATQGPPAEGGADRPVARTFIDRWTGDSSLPRFLDRCKRLQRQGWTVTVLYEFDGDEIVALGCLEAGAEPVPDRQGQYELAVGL